jgi:hypothetical protein
MSQVGALDRVVMAEVVINARLSMNGNRVKTSRAFFMKTKIVPYVNKSHLLG